MILLQALQALNRMDASFKQLPKPSQDAQKNPLLPELPWLLAAVMSNHPPKCTHHLFSGGTVIESDSHGYVDLDSTKAKMVNQKILIMPVETKNAKYSLSLFPAGKDLGLPVGLKCEKDDVFIFLPLLVSRPTFNKV